MATYNGPTLHLMDYFNGFVAGIMNTTSPDDA